MNRPSKGISPWAAVAACSLSLVFPAEGQEHPEDELGLERFGSVSPEAPAWETYVSPTALAATSDGRQLFIACATANRVVVFDTERKKVSQHLEVPASPQGLALSPDGSRLYVACAAPDSTICLLDTGRHQIVQRLKAGHTAMSPVLSPDEKRLYVCNRFNHDVSVFDLPSGRELKRIPVVREPVAAAITSDGRYLVVANHLHGQPAHQLHIWAEVTILDTASLTVRKNIPLTFGSGLLNGVAISPNGRFAAITHLRSMYWLSTTAVELGHMNGSALSVLDLDRLEVLGTVLLDRTERGAANPWAVGWTPDGKTIAVTHAGGNEVSLIDAPQIADPASFPSMRIGAYEPSEMSLAPVPRQQPVRVRQWIALPGVGPRAMALVGSQLYVANYFSDNLCRINLQESAPKAELLSLGRILEPSQLRWGEMLFNDSHLCRQAWQSCASCHDADGRTDALNWDLLNDGLANPKNTKSLLWAYQTGPAMALGVRTNAAEAVLAGIHHILFGNPSETVAAAIDAWLKSLQPVPSPHLVNGHLSPAAERGRQLFLRPKTGCVECHPPPLFADKLGHDVGTAHEYHGMYGVAGADQPAARFYTPTLVELWRTAPFLHDGSALSLREVLTVQNPQDRHGRTSQLTAREIEDLVEYLLSL